MFLVLKVFVRISVSMFLGITGFYTFLRVCGYVPCLNSICSHFCEYVSFYNSFFNHFCVYDGLFLAITAFYALLCLRSLL